MEDDFFQRKERKGDLERERVPDLPLDPADGLAAVGDFLKAGRVEEGGGERVEDATHVTRTYTTQRIQMNKILPCHRHHIIVSR